MKRRLMKVLLAVTVFFIFIGFLFKKNAISKIDQSIVYYEDSVDRLIQDLYLDSQITFINDSVWITKNIQNQNNIGLLKNSRNFIFYSFGYDRDNDSCKPLFLHTNINGFTKYVFDGDILIIELDYKSVVSALRKFKYGNRYFYKKKKVFIADSLDRYNTRQCSKFISQNLNLNIDPLNLIIDERVAKVWNSIHINRDTFFVLNEHNEVLNFKQVKIVKSIVEYYSKLIKNNYIDSIVTHVEF